MTAQVIPSPTVSHSKRTMSGLTHSRSKPRERYARNACTDETNTGGTMNLAEFLTLENAIKYNNEQNKLFFIADELEIAATGRKVIWVEDQLIDILQANNIEIKD
jgi:hypothetical protein